MKQEEYTEAAPPQWPSQCDEYAAELLSASVDEAVAVKIVDEATKIIVGEGIPQEVVRKLIDLLSEELSTKVANSSIIEE